MMYMTRFRLISNFLGVSLLVGGLSLLAGSRLIYSAVFNEATNRVRQDLNAAREIYDSQERLIGISLSLLTEEQDFRAALRDRRVGYLQRRLQGVVGQIGLDFAGVVRDADRVLLRVPGGAGGGAADLATGADADPADRLINPAALLAYARGRPVVGTVVLDERALAAESPRLAQAARIPIIPTPRAAPRPGAEETSGLAVIAAVPVIEGEILLGVIYGGTLLNGRTDFVDRVRETVFQSEMYRGQGIGTATVFLQDLRIATNVLTPEGQRATGTLVSQAVKEKVLDRGERWTDRAFVVDGWYITAYEPITDVFGKRVGILYVGVLEAKYTELRRGLLSVFFLITLAGVGVAILLGYLLSNRILRPVHQLISASERVSQGDLSPQIGPISRSEIGTLQKTFLKMLSSLRERDRLAKAESESKMLLSEKQASVGRLAAGVAHEINNPLTGVLTFTHMLLRRKDLDPQMQADLQTIAASTERVRNIVKGLLDFSRQIRLDPEPTDINALIQHTVTLVTNQALMKGVIFCFDPGEGIPQLRLDRNQMQSVLLNIFLNAIDATDRGGHVNVSSNLTISTGKVNRREIEIVISDTGCGIPPENLDKLFDPFFTTKEVGKGTGLGLSVSLGIVQRHGGTIRVRSKVGQGSTFLIWLPLDEEEGG